MFNLPSYVPADEAGPQASVAAIREGLPVEAFDWLMSHLDVSPDSLGVIVHISLETVRRRRAESGRFTPAESERVLRLIRLFRHASEVLGGPSEAREWMKEQNFALGDVSPLEFSDTEPGARRVDDLLGQIEHGLTA
jgi:putative toxin-antitoxin system antitoxin component (TIGR02293 family)